VQKRPFKNTIPAKGEPEFIEFRAPSDEQVWEVLERIIKRVMKHLVRRGILVEDQGGTYLAAIEKILTHLGLEARAPPRSPARGQMTLQDI
jgi:hypothetical protein